MGDPLRLLKLHEMSLILLYQTLFKDLDNKQDLDNKRVA